jgi:hypothetical protein
MIFKLGSFEEELFQGMIEAEQQAEIKEESHIDNLVFAALQELDLAAQQFDNIGKSDIAADVTSLINEIVNSPQF